MNADVYYVLDGEEIKVVNLEAHVKWASEHSGVIVQDRLSGVVVSTVFLYIDHNHVIGGAPILFETMVFRYEGFKDGSSMHEIEEERYHTLSEAIVGHKMMIGLLITNRFAYLVNMGIHISQEVEHLYVNPHYKDKLQ